MLVGHTLCIVDIGDSHRWDRLLLTRKKTLKACIVFPLSLFHLDMASTLATIHNLWFLLVKSQFSFDDLVSIPNKKKLNVSDMLTVLWYSIPSVILYKFLFYPMFLDLPSADGWEETLQSNDLFKKNELMAWFVATICCWPRHHLFRVDTRIFCWPNHIFLVESHVWCTKPTFSTMKSALFVVRSQICVKSWCWWNRSCLLAK